jgi:hypothetical protein
MKMVDIRRYEMLVRVKKFGVAHADLFPSTTAGGKLFAAVSASVDGITSRGTQQAQRAVARDTSTAKAAARATLRESLLKISRMARAVAAETPGLDDKFLVPRSHSDQRLLLAARAFVENATPVRDQFVAHHMPATFLDDLAAQIDAFEGALEAHAVIKESHAAARVGIADALASGLAAVERLDAIMPNALEQQRDTLAEWQSARHVSKQSVPYPNRQKPSAPDAPKVAA